MTFETPCWELQVSGSDHEFDADQVTPGPYFVKFQALLKEAAEMREGAHRARTVANLEDVAADAEALARDLENQARELLKTF